MFSFFLSSFLFLGKDHINNIQKKKKKNTIFRKSVIDDETWKKKGIHSNI